MYNIHIVDQYNEVVEGNFKDEESANKRLEILKKYLGQKAKKWRIVVSWCS